MATTIQKTHPDMLQWQFKVLIAELQQLQLHASDQSCPCSLANLGEFCISKHALMVSTLALETAAMDATNADVLYTLGDEADEIHQATKDSLCNDDVDIPDIVEWSRRWRKKLEDIYYSCSVRMKQPDIIITSEVRKSEESPVLFSAKCFGNKCSIALSGETYIDVTISGSKNKKQYHLLADTGSSYVGLPNSEIEFLGLIYVGDYRFETPKGFVTGPVYSGGLKYKNQAIPILVSLISSETTPFLGYQVLENLKLKVNSVTRQVELAQEGGLKSKCYLTNKCSGGEDMTELKQPDPLLAEIVSQICNTGACFARDDKLPVCSGTEKKARESCIRQLKARNIEAGCKPEGTGSKKCPNVFAVCQTALKCRKSEA